MAAGQRGSNMEKFAPYLIVIGRVVLSLVILTELGGGLCVLLGLFTRYAAIALAGFCVLAAWFFHYQPGDMGQMINFMKNITIAGGFLVLAGAGPGAFALDNLRR